MNNHKLKLFVLGKQQEDGWTGAYKLRTYAVQEDPRLYLLGHLISLVTL